VESINRKSYRRLYAENEFAPFRTFTRFTYRQRHHLDSSVQLRYLASRRIRPCKRLMIRKILQEHVASLPSVPTQVSSITLDARVYSVVVMIVISNVKFGYQWLR
jgi:hypothetical protein